MTRESITSLFHVYKNIALELLYHILNIKAFQVWDDIPWLEYFTYTERNGTTAEHITGKVCVIYFP